MFRNQLIDRCMKSGVCGGKWWCLMCYDDVVYIPDFLFWRSLPKSIVVSMAFMLLHLILLLTVPLNFLSTVISKPSLDRGLTMHMKASKGQQGILKKYFFWGELPFFATFIKPQKFEWAYSIKYSVSNLQTHGCGRVDDSMRMVVIFGGLTAFGFGVALAGPTCFRIFLI